jgi:hypothetical protein
MASVVIPCDEFYFQRVGARPSGMRVFGASFVTEFSRLDDPGCSLAE